MLIHEIITGPPLETLGERRFTHLPSSSGTKHSSEGRQPVGNGPLLWICLLIHYKTNTEGALYLPYALNLHLSTPSYTVLDGYVRRKGYVCFKISRSVLQNLAFLTPTRRRDYVKKPEGQQPKRTYSKLWQSEDYIRNLDRPGMSCDKSGTFSEIFFVNTYPAARA
ncbi:hypothetical protein MMC20_007721 [Loxospora ochrophaea]|nr:hypothetical protein [Loxospora ochrophaea]